MDLLKKDISEFTLEDIERIKGLRLDYEATFKHKVKVGKAYEFMFGWGDTAYKLIVDVDYENFKVKTIDLSLKDSKETEWDFLSTCNLQILVDDTKLFGYFPRYRKWLQTQ